MVIDRHKDDTMTDPVLDDLHRRRDQLVVEVRRAEAIIQRTVSDIESLDNAIRLFDPSHRAVSPAVNPIGAGNRITRTILTILRKAPEPMTLRTLTVVLMETVGLNHRDRKRVKRMMEQVRTALARQNLNGTVGKEMGANRAMVWQIASKHESAHHPSVENLYTLLS